MATARAILAAVPEVMYYLRGATRAAGPGKAGGCTIPQIRTLAFVHRYPKTTLSEVADCLGVTLPTASRLVETLVSRKMISRRVDAHDRRNLCLCLTPRGVKQLGIAQQWGRQHIAAPLRSMQPREVQQIRQIMKLIQGAFALPSAPRRRRQGSLAR
jgi:DNA-binding MarR family transcriptional regulator